VFVERQWRYRSHWSLVLILCGGDRVRDMEEGGFRFEGDAGVPRALSIRFKARLLLGCDHCAKAPQSIRAHLVLALCVAYGHASLLTAAALLMTSAQGDICRDVFTALYVLCLPLLTFPPF
jgi:hypothetical protein